ncbi:MAG: hypothetical protein K9I99_14035 [Melioribacteraceae bacterium]|nr:hypothetical protein [Melioribacteraceae bacterium]
MFLNKLVALVLLAVFISACSNEKPENIRTDFAIKTADEKHFEKAKELNVKVRTKKLFTYDNQTKSLTDSDKIGERVFFNADRTLNKIERYNTNGEIHTMWIYEHDQDGNLIKMESYDGETRLAMVREMKFDENGNEILRQERRTQKRTISFEYRSYNEYGQKTKERIEDQDGKLIGEEEYIYDNYLLIEVQNKNITGYVLGKSVYEYDENGNIISVKRIREDDILSEIFYEYDENGNVTRIDQGFFYRTFSYDTDNNLIEEQNFLDTGERQKKHIFTYYENGLLKEIIDYSPTDEQRYKFVFEYEFYE